MAGAKQLLLTFLAVVAVAFAEDFTICKKHLHKLGVVNIHKFDVSPSTPTAGQSIQLSLSGYTSKDIVEGTVAKVLVRAVGIEIASHKFDVCSLEGISCPFAAGNNFEASISLRVPFQVPDGVAVEVAVEFLQDEEVFGCVEVDMKVVDAAGRNNRFGFDIDEVEFLFKKWMSQHKIHFKPAEYLKRKAIFTENLIKIALHNAKGKSWKMGMNQFGHLEPEEFKKTYATGLIPPVLSMLNTDSNITTATYRRLPSEELPTEVNWVTAGAVTDVKNQGACGSCWSFSTTGALEGAYFVKYKKLISFSEQELVACDPVDQGCQGGMMDNAYEWIEKNGGLCSESDYPYTAGSGNRGMCKKNSCRVVPNSSPPKFFDVQRTEGSLEGAVAKQPVAVAIEADQTSFQFYQGGVLTARCGTNLDHGVLLVGYGTENGQDYWLVKNSWGSMWGSHGYIKIARGIKQNGGECGILLSASYPQF